MRYVRYRKLVPFLLLALSGCAEVDLTKPLLSFDVFDMRKGIPWGHGQDGKLEHPLKVTAFWTDSIMTTTGQPATRGFGGRLMFYGSGKDPIKVNGELAVYAFDETNRDPTDPRPTRKFVITAEQLKQHYSKGELGDSYSVWLPWDQVGGPQTEISLIVRFTPLRGGVVVGEQSKHVLPGIKPPETKKLPAAAGDGVQQASYQSQAQAASAPSEPEIPAESVNDAERKMTTTTIAIPNRFGQPLASGVPMSNTNTTVRDVRHPAPKMPAVQTAPASSPAPQQPGVRFGRPRSRPLGGPLEPLPRDHARWPQSRGGWQSGLGSSPQSPQG